MIPSDLERQHHFTYPTLYQQLAEDGLLSGETPGASRPALGRHVELLPLTQASELTAALADPKDYRYVRSDYQFIVFGQDNSGNYYCFLAGGQVAGELPVVILWGALAEATFLARNLQDFIFRSMLLDLSGYETGGTVSFGDFRQTLVAALETYGRYLTEKQHAMLHDLLRRAPVSWQEHTTTYRDAPDSARGFDIADTTRNWRGFLTRKEAATILADTIAFDKLDTSLPVKRR